MSKHDFFSNILMQAFDQNFPILSNNVSRHHNEGELIFDDVARGEAELGVQAVFNITAYST